MRSRRDSRRDGAKCGGNDLVVDRLMRKMDPALRRAVCVAAAWRGKDVEGYVADTLLAVMRETADDVLAQVSADDIRQMCAEYAKSLAPAGKEVAP